MRYVPYNYLSLIFKKFQSENWTKLFEGGKQQVWNLTLNLRRENKKYSLDCYKELMRQTMKLNTFKVIWHKLIVSTGKGLASKVKMLSYYWRNWLSTPIFKRGMAALWMKRMMTITIWSEEHNYRKKLSSTTKNYTTEI